MEKYKIELFMLTVINMARNYLITKESMENYCKGGDNSLRDSVNDDLESFFNDLQLGRKPNERAETYFLPKLTRDELKLIERKDASYLETFYFDDLADVKELEMQLSESKSKFVYGTCLRKTFTIKRGQPRS